MKLSTKLAIGALTGLTLATGLGIYGKCKSSKAKDLGYKIDTETSINPKGTEYANLTKLMNGVTINVASESLNGTGTIKYVFEANGNLEITTKFTGLIGSKTEALADIARIKAKVIEIESEHNSLDDIEKELNKLSFTAFKKSTITLSK